MAERFEQRQLWSDKQYWEQIYAHKTPDQRSWTQEVPQTSLDFIHAFNLSRQARILDVGAGDSRLVDFLLEEGFENITVLDISAEALKNAKERLGHKSGRVTWVVSDIRTFQAGRPYDLWHDRATFHFLTTKHGVSQYLPTARKSVNGYMILGTFSTDGPEKCSGLPIQQYSEMTLTRQLDKGFKKLRCVTDVHLTPFGTRQSFLFCSFRSKEV